jgi:DNA repair exonuclease SbcCD ATPase subunit
MEEDTTKDLNLKLSSEERILAAIETSRIEMTSFRDDMNSFRDEMNTFRDETNAKFSLLESRVATVERKIDGLGAKQEVFDLRLARLEEKVEARMQETQPIWEAVLARLSNIEHTLEEMNREMRILVADFFKLRARVERLEDERISA